MKNIRSYKDDISRLQIRWKERSYYYDIFDEDFFHNECNDTRKVHYLFYYKSDDEKEIEVNCKVNITEREAILDYRGLNLPELEIHEGILKILFTDDTRTEVRKVLWKDCSSAGGRFQEKASSNWQLSKDFSEGSKYKNEKEIIRRNRTIVQQKKQISNYQCESCGFRLKANGHYIIKCHHLTPISQAGESEVSLKDLVCLCPNCHRIAHTMSPPMALEDIRSLIRKNNESLMNNT